jgi:hypothetical protein
MIDGPVPLAIFDKPQQGTGASLLAETISIICSGRPAAMMGAKRSDEEWEKSLTSLLMKGRLLVSIDNVVGILDSPILGTMLTCAYYEARVLGRSESMILPIRCTWIATGNNIQLRGDLPRRCIWVRLDAKQARPWLRDPSTFKHPRLMEWVSEDRGRILAAILTIARGYVAAGMPGAEEKPNLGGYESYCRVLRGVLAFMDIRGFLANLLTMYTETDSETPQWEAFFETWRESIGDKAVTAAELIDHLKDNAALHAALHDAIGDTEAPNYVVRLGQKLGKQKGVRYPNSLGLVVAGEKKRAVTWQVVRFENTTSPNLTVASKTGEVAPDDNPDCPNHPCRNCGCSDYWLPEARRCGKAERLCSRCHPKPEERSGQ